MRQLKSGGNQLAQLSQLTNQLPQKNQLMAPAAPNMRSKSSALRGPRLRVAALTINSFGSNRWTHAMLPGGRVAVLLLRHATAYRHHQHQHHRFDTQPPTWADERASVLEAIQTWADEREVILEVVRGLRELCENLGNQLAELRWRQLGTAFDPPQAAFSELKQWANAEAPLCDAKESPATAGLSLGVPPSQRCALQPSME